jgi:hypothetical protein
MLSSSIISPTLQAAECPDVRLDLDNGPVAPIPVYNQVDHDICYAIIAAQLVDAYRFSFPETDRTQLTSYLVAGAHFSAKYRETLNNMSGVPSSDGIDLGDVLLTIEELKERGSCDQTRLFKSAQAIDTHANLSDIESVLNGLRKQGKKGSLPDFNCSQMDRIGFSSNLTAFGNDLEQIIKSDKFYLFLDGFLSDVCKPISIPLKDLPTPQDVKFTDELKRGGGDKTAFSQALQASLGAAHPQPMAVNLCRQAIFPPDDNSNPACTPHSVMIVGSHPSGSGGCSVLVRETLGPTCDSTVPWECDDKKKGEYWIPMSQVAKKTLQLVYFKRN